MDHTNKDKPLPLTETKYGFSWGQVTVERCISHKGTAVLTITTHRECMSVRVTPTGLVRVESVRKVKH